MLLWAAAAAIPIVLHLLTRRTQHVTQWAAMEFLQAAIRKHARRMRLEQLLLLALRATILALLALAAARPTLRGVPATFGGSVGQIRSYTILVVDGSYSMRYRHGNGSRFTDAVRRASQIVQESGQGDGFSLVLMADPPQTVIGDVAFDRNDVQQELDHLHPTQAGAPLGPALDQVKQLLEQTHRQFPRLQRHRVVFLTDLGRATWEDAIQEDIRRRFAELADQAELYLIPAQPLDANHVAITSLTTDRELPVVGDSVSIQVEVRHYGTRSGAPVRLDLLVDGDVVAERTMDLSAANRTEATFLHRFATPGEHLITARLAPDRLALDNIRWLAIPVRDQLRVLCVAGRQDAAKYVALALAPQEDGATRVTPEVVPESELLQRELSQYDVVWLCNIGRFDKDESQWLRRYVRGGGTLIVSLGDQVQAENYNAELGQTESDESLLPARLQHVVGGQVHLFDPLDYRHAIVAPFRGHERAGLLTVPTWRYVRLEVVDPDRSVTALAFRNGDPAIVQQQHRAGTVILVATAVSLASWDHAADPPVPWSAWPSWPSFPPLVHQLVEEGTRRRSSGRNLIVGQSLSANVPVGTVTDAVFVTDPEGRRQHVPVADDGYQRRWHFGQTQRSGVYRAAFGKDDQREQLFAVNLDTQESDLLPVDPAGLPSQLQTWSPSRQLAEATIETDDRPWPLFRITLALVALLLVGESLMAWRFGGVGR